MADKELVIYSEGQMERAPDTAVAAAEAKATQEVQAALVIARKFPRDEERARDKIMDMCARQTFAEASQYSYPRGGQEVTGPSIRLTEGIARAWGNVVHGIEVLSEDAAGAKVRAWAWDLESNNRHEMTFTVEKTRKAHGRYESLADPRDVYEHVTNMATRRLRACLLRILPADIVEDACEACNQTIAGKGEKDVAVTIRKLCEAFRKIGVNREMIAARVQHPVDALKPAEIASLRKLYAAIKDGYTTVDAVFAPATPSESAAEKVSPTVREVLSGQNAGGADAKKSPTTPTGETTEVPPSATEPAPSDALLRLTQLAKSKPDAYAEVLAANDLETDELHAMDEDLLAQLVAEINEKGEK
jgi:hypothetical protein